MKWLKHSVLLGCFANTAQRSSGFSPDHEFEVAWSIVITWLPHVEAQSNTCWLSLMAKFQHMATHVEAQSRICFPQLVPHYFSTCTGWLSMACPHLWPHWSTASMASLGMVSPQLCPHNFMARRWSYLAFGANLYHASLPWTFKPWNPGFCMWHTHSSCLCIPSSQMTVLS